MIPTNLPEGWKIVKLGEIVNDILTGATPLRSKKEYWENGTIPWLTNEELKEGIINYITKTKQKITEKALKETNVKLIPPNSLILSLTASVGKVAINKVPITTNQQFNALILKKDKIVTEFLAYYLIFSKKRIEQLGGLTTFKFISKETIKKLEVILPSLPEQKAIAKILSTIDKAIQKVDEIIAKTEKLKKGLMQRLLTKGIGHKEFKYSKELGCEIPKEWEVVKLKNISEDIQQGFASGKRDPNGVIQLRMNNVTTDGRLVLDSYIKVPRPPHIERYLLKIGDILFNNTNSVDLIGKTTLIDRNMGEITFSNHFTRIRVKKDRVTPYWIKYYFIKKWEMGFFKQICRRHVHQAGIGKNILENIKIPLPPLPEQQKIVEILCTIDKKLELERERKEKLERIKKGMMNLLLTGKVRVKGI